MGWATHLPVIDLALINTLEQGEQRALCNNDILFGNYAVSFSMPRIETETAMRKGAKKSKPNESVSYALENTKILSLGLAVKLGSIVVHADELTGLDGRELDRQVIRQALADTEVTQWIKDMGCLLPVKRIK